MFFFEGFLVMFLAATPLAALLIFNREKLSLPRHLQILAMLTLLASVFVGIGLVGVIFGSEQGL
jgi:hypothetical protein